MLARLAVTPSDPARRDAVSVALFAAGATGLLEDGAAFVTLFDDQAAARTAAAAIAAADAGARIEESLVDPGDYTAAWRSGVQARTIGRVTISPPWLADAHASPLTVVIEPGTGFGTGEHESTRATLALLQDVVRAGDVVADVGSGSGVLAIAAVKLGAARAVAMEIDVQAIPNAEENVARNDVADRVTVVEGDAAVLLPLLAPVRVIVANIIATTLSEMLPMFAAALPGDGDVIVGGILADEREAFVATCAPAGFHVAREMTEGAWWSGHLRRAT